MTTTPSPPSWPHCAHGAGPTDPVGCRGIHVPGHTACLAHLTDTDCDTYLAGLTPGADIDHRGTPFTESLLNALLNALRAPDTGHPRLGHATFELATFMEAALFESAVFECCALFGSTIFEGSANFVSATFKGDDALFVSATFRDSAWFTGATFEGRAEFGHVTFEGHAGFDKVTFGGGDGYSGATFGSATFEGRAEFGMTTFEDYAGFGSTTFKGDAGFFSTTFKDNAQFGQTVFEGDALFYQATFRGNAWFASATFKSDAGFEDAAFERAANLGPLICDGTVELSGAMFGVPVTLEISAKEVMCTRTRWQSTATVRVRHAAVDLGHAVLEAPLAVIAHQIPFTTIDGILDESALPGSGAVRVVSVQGVDAAHLVLTDTDLSDCLFSGAFHLDQLRLEGRTTLASTPTGWHRKGIAPIRWTRRRTLAEEHHWRAQTAGQLTAPAGTPPEPRRWRTGPHHPDPARTPDPDDVAALYRQLRKAFEDGKNEPGAADFYYGECEMRRHDRTGTPTAERRLLWAYWLLSGYGLRAGRALGWLAAAMLATIVLLMAFGLPASSPKQEATGTVPPGGGKVTFVIDKQDPKNPTRDRFTSKRFDKALSVTLNSVVFRSSGQDLTTTGTYIEMTSRILEPALLALAVLAVRGRIKR
ncbi:MULTISPECIES: pentapeptide repeat-containing protein [Streptomyces]|uniref:Pentapeptide repeat-containing protein n=2 Tax=Streptomyces TaxID=1883 RepID=A0ABU4K2N0_9ACTN|nr:pentapeptide repeat-containing protein [Streptomyces roseolus]MDX2291814.1 pentapeptide repeat-containing protein [Streptomyces roseolus]